MNILLLTVALLTSQFPAPPFPLDPEMPLGVYVIRGGPQPAAVPLHVWSREEIWPELCWDGHPPWGWHLYRRPGAPPLRKTEECPFGTWVPVELDTPFHRAMRRKVGLTNYEVYEVPILTLARLPPGATLRVYLPATDEHKQEHRGFRYGIRVEIDPHSDTCRVVGKFFVDAEGAFEFPAREALADEIGRKPAAQREQWWAVCRQWIAKDETLTFEVDQETKVWLAVRSSP